MSLRKDLFKVVQLHENCVYVEIDREQKVQEMTHFELNLTLWGYCSAYWRRRQMESKDITSNNKTVKFVKVCKLQ